jgi:hypothetical protein
MIENKEPNSNDNTNTAHTKHFQHGAHALTDRTNKIKTNQILLVDSLLFYGQKNIVTVLNV